MPWSNPGYLRVGQLVLDSSDQQMLVYDGVPQYGNLILAISSVAGSDSYGNDYWPGISAPNTANIFAPDKIIIGWNPSSSSGPAPGIPDIYLGTNSTPFQQLLFGTVPVTFHNQNAAIGVQTFSNVFAQPPSIQLTVQVGSNYDINANVQSVSTSSFAWRMFQTQEGLVTGNAVLHWMAFA